MTLHLPAAVFREDDPRAASAARVVPRSAKTKKVGSAIIGYYKSAQKGRVGLRPLRLAELKRIILARHGRGGVDTDDGQSYFEFACHHLSDAPAMRAFAKRFTPLLSSEEVESVVDAALNKPRTYLADEAARALGVIRTERERLALHTIGAIDHDAVARGEERRCKDREAKRAKRAAEPKRVTNTTATKPWTAFGWSRRTWYRKGRPMPDGTNGVGNKILYSTADALCAKRPVRRAEAPKHRSPGVHSDPRLLRIAENVRAFQARLATVVRPINTVSAHLQHIGAIARAVQSGACPHES